MPGRSHIEAIEGSSLAIVSVGADGRIEHLNGAAAALLGDARGTDLGDPPPHEDPRGPLVALSRVWEERDSEDLGPDPILIRGKVDGISRFLLCHVAPSGRGGAGRVFVIADLTRLLSGSEPVRRLVAQLAHDLRSPLASISGAAELLLSRRLGPLEVRQEKLLRIVDEGTTKMSAIIENAYERSQAEEVAQ